MTLEFFFFFNCASLTKTGHDLMFMFLHLEDAFIQSDLHSYPRLAGSVRRSCLRTPTGGCAFHAGTWQTSP